MRCVTITLSFPLSLAQCRTPAEEQLASTQKTTVAAAAEAKQRLETARREQEAARLQAESERSFYDTWSKHCAKADKTQ